MNANLTHLFEIWHFTHEYIVNKKNKKYYVIYGFSNGVRTKWVTMKKWYGIISIKMNEKNPIYKDDRNNKILIYKENEDGFKEW